MSKKQPQNSRTTNMLFLIAVIVIGAYGIYYIAVDSDTKVIGENKEYEVISSSNQNVNRIVYDGYDLNIDNGFEVSVPEGWSLISNLEDAINVVKFGSPAQIYLIAPEGSQDDLTGPAISFDTFTIDENLNATEVANLIHDQGIVDDLEREKENCFFDLEKAKFEQFDYVSFIRDNSDPEKCDEEGTGIGKSLTVVLKEEGNADTVILTLVTKNASQFDGLLPEFQQVWGSLKYSKKDPNTNTDLTNESD